MRVPQAIALGPGGGKADIYLVVQVLDDPNYERKGDDLHTIIAIDLYKAVLGGDVKIPTLSGNVVLLIPPGTQPEQIFRLAGRGMPHLKNPSEHGDMFVRIKVNLPRKLTTRQRELFQQLSQS